MDKELIKYIQKSIKNGYSINQIKETLIRNNYDIKTIEYHLSHFADLGGTRYKLLFFSLVAIIIFAVGVAYFLNLGTKESQTNTEVSKKIETVAFADNANKLNNKLESDLFVAHAKSSDMLIGTNKIPASGYVGIGTTNPMQALDVIGYVKTSQGLCIGNDCKNKWPAGITSIYYVNATKETSSITSGTGVFINYNTTTSSAVISLDADYVQKKITSQCPLNSSIRTINSDGTVVCEYHNINSIDASSFQKRVLGICPLGSSIRLISVDGSVVCETDDSANATDASDWNKKDNNVYYIGGNIGIGTAAPEQKLHVMASDFPGLIIDRAGSSKWGMGPSGSKFYLYHYGTGSYLLTLDGSTGNVGIGTKDPQAKLDVNGGPIKASGGLIIETRFSDPPNPETGQMWLIVP